MGCTKFYFDIVNTMTVRYFDDPGRDRLCVEGWFRLSRALGDVERGVKRSAPGVDSAQYLSFESMISCLRIKMFV